MPQPSPKGNGPSIRVLRHEVNDWYRYARERLTEDGYRGIELERLATRMVEAAVFGRETRESRGPR